MTEADRVRLLVIILWMTAAHSFFTGVMLFLQPAAVLRWTGFAPVGEAFFPAQGGVFHVLMSVLYAAAALRRTVWRLAAAFIIFVKASAALFLIAYYVFASPVWLILLSGVADGMIAVILAFFHGEGRRTYASG
ncbi:MAG: hypothetical protein RRA94_02110 [Bacteroidota bacterium]|nr:hypothetical protein [Bacteroidota bacterium]